MSLPLTNPPAPYARRTSLRPFGAGPEGYGLDMVEAPGEPARLSVETGGDRLRFRIVLDVRRRPRLLLDMPPRTADHAASSRVAAWLDAHLRDGDGSLLAGLAARAAARESAQLHAAGQPTAEALSMLAADLAAWRAMPAEARLPLGPFLERCGSGLAPAFEAASLPAILASAEAAAEAMMSGGEAPRACASDPCLSAVGTVIERARAMGVRSSRHVSVGMAGSEAPRLAGVPAAQPLEELASQVANRRVTADDLLVVSCAAPSSEGLARLLRLLSRYGVAARLVVFDADEVLVGAAPPLSRALGIPVGA